MTKEPNKYPNKIKKQRSRKDTWDDIIERYSDLSDGEFIDELVKNYQPPNLKIKPKINLES